jgi:hypothetical protein
MPTSAGPNSKGENSLVFAFDMADTQNSNLGLPVHNVIRPLNEWRRTAVQIEELPKGSYKSPIRNARIWKCRYDVNDTWTTNPLTRDAGEGYYPGANLLILPDTVWRGESLYYYSMWVRGFNTNASNASVSMDLNDRNVATASASDEVWRKLEVYNTRAHDLTNFDFHDLYPNRGSKDSIDFLVTGLMLCRTEGNEYAELGSITTPPAWLPEGAIRSNAAINPVDKTPLSLNVSYTSDKTFEFDGTDDGMTGYCNLDIRNDFSVTVVAFYDDYKSSSADELGSVIGTERDGGVNINRQQFLVTTKNYWQRNDESNNGFWIGWGGQNTDDPTAGSLVVTLNANSNRDQVYVSLPSSVNEYVEITLVKSGSTMSVYRNGSLYQSKEIPFEITTNSWLDDRIAIGGRGDTNIYKWSQSIIPIVKAYQKALSAKEVLANFEVIRKRFNI